MRILNSVAIVTGGAQGIGRAIVEKLLVREAKRVVVTDINEAVGFQTVKDLNATYGKDRCHFMRCSVAKRPELVAVFQKAMQLEGRLDIVANNAGILNESDPDAVIDTNLKGVVYGSQLALEFMSKQRGGQGGVVINTSSIAGLTAMSFCPVYSATKHAVVGYTGSMGSELQLKLHGVRFNCICPAIIDTEIVTNLDKPGVSLFNEEFFQDKTTFPFIEMSVFTDHFVQLVEHSRELNGFAVSILPPDQVEYLDKAMKPIV